MQAASIDPHQLQEWASEWAAQPARPEHTLLLAGLALDTDALSHLMEQGLLNAAEGSLTSLEQLASAGHSATALAVLAAGAAEPLPYAAAAGLEACTRLLLQEGADVEACSGGLSPLALAAQGGHAAVVAVLLAAGASRESGSPLSRAALNGRLAVVAVLLQPGAPSDAPYALMLAASQGHVQIVEALLAARVDPNAFDEDGSGPLHCAAAENRTACLLALLAAGADPSAADASGLTAAHLAAATGSAACLEQLLLARPTCCRAVDRHGATPLLYVERKGHDDCAAARGTA